MKVRTLALRYGAAVLAVLLGWLVREALTPSIGPNALPFITFFPVVAWATWYGGFGPGLLSIALSALVSDWFYFEPLQSLRLENPIAFVGFPVAAGLIFVAIQAMHRAQRKLSQTHDTLDTTLRSIGDGVIVTDARGRVTFLNPEGERLTGWSMAGALSRPLTEVFQIVHEVTRAEVENPVFRAMREGAVTGLANHTLLLNKTGSERSIDDSAAPIRDSEGQVVGSVLVFRDVTRRRQSETILQRAEEHSRSVVDNVLDGIIAIDDSGRIRSFNRAAESLFGYGADEVIGQNVKMLMPEPYHSEHDGYVHNYLKTGTAKIIGIGREVVGRRKDGSTFPMELAVSEFTVANARYFTGIVRDLTERNQREAALREGEARFRVALDGTPVAVFNCDRDLRFSWMYNAQPPFDATRVIGKRAEELLPPDSVRELAELLQLVITSGAGERRVVAIPHEGETLYFDCAVEPVREENGDIVGVRGALADISARRRVEVERERLRVELAAKAQELQAIFDIAPVQIWFGDAECRTFYGNRLAYEEHGLQYGINASFDAPVRELPPGFHIEVDGRTLESSEMPMQLAARTGKPVHHFEHDIVHGDGRRRTMWANVAPLFDEHGNVRGIVGAYVDVTSLRAAERALREADQRKNEFLATLAHELRNPLAPIRNSIALLQLKGPPDRELADARAVIDRQVRQMSRLLDDLLDVNRLDRNKLALRKEPVTVRSVIDRALETARPGIESRNHRVTIDAPDDIVIDGDPLRLAQVFANLLNNAAKYSDDGGRIWIRAEREDGFVAVSVKDSGVGISTAAMPRLFRMFAQAPDSLERAEGGAGIGLSLAKGLVELHGGAISAESEGIGKGSVFTVRLPILTDPALPPVTSEERRIRVAAPPRRILIADDVRDNADTLAMILRALNHTVEVAYDGAQAVAAAEQFRPDVAVLDIAMPLMNGLEACRHIRQQPWGKSIYMIAQTGWGQEEDRRRVTEAGFDRHMLKPVDSTAVVAVLASLSGTTEPDNSRGPST